MVKAFYKDLIVAIFIVLLLLGVCVSIDYADDTITVKNTTVNVPKGAILVNNSSVVGLNESASTIVGRSSDKIYTVKQKYPTITITARPSVRSKYAYRWYTTTWIDYCPHCHRYNVLYNAHKYQARHEQELTCRRCGADYCGVVGKEKYSWSHYYLRKC